VAYHFPNGTGWLGFFVLTTPYRSQGLGRRTFKAAMDSFQANGNMLYIGLDSVPQQRETYGRRGFLETDIIAICTRSNAKDIPSTTGVLNDDEVMIDLRQLNADQLVESDLAHCGLKRTLLWTYEALFHRRDATGFAFVHRDNKALKGWILIRRCELGYRIGPLYAERKDISSYLLHAAMSGLEDKNVSLTAETWHSNKHAVKTFEELGWKWVGNYHRMWYDGRVPPAQGPGGKAEREMYAVFDAVEG
jgi:GNAT superfamily N-acetyltransferase